LGNIAETLARYAALVTAGDVDGIVALYAPDAEIQIPANGALHRGIDAIRSFYRDNELARRLEIVGPACVAGLEAAVPMRAQVARDGQLLELDVVDVAAFDERGRFTRMRAFFDLDGARPLGRS
jgi:steroid delta-isomerase